MTEVERIISFLDLNEKENGLKSILWKIKKLKVLEKIKTILVKKLLNVENSLEI